MLARKAAATCYYMGRKYMPITPRPDNDNLAATGDRLLLIHNNHSNPEFMVARKDTLSRGWVIGLFPED